MTELKILKEKINQMKIINKFNTELKGGKKNE